jgi:hypothetical protein
MKEWNAPAKLLPHNHDDNHTTAVILSCYSSPTCLSVDGVWFAVGCREQLIGVWQVQIPSTSTSQETQTDIRFLNVSHMFNIRTEWQVHSIALSGPFLAHASEFELRVLSIRQYQHNDIAESTIGSTVAIDPSFIKCAPFIPPEAFVAWSGQQTCIHLPSIQMEQRAAVRMLNRGQYLIVRCYQSKLLIKFGWCDCLSLLLLFCRSFAGHI